LTNSGANTIKISDCTHSQTHYNLSVQLFNCRLQDKTLLAATSFLLIYSSSVLAYTPSISTCSITNETYSGSNHKTYRGTLTVPSFTVSGISAPYCNVVCKEYDGDSSATNVGPSTTYAWKCDQANGYTVPISSSNARPPVACTVYYNKQQSDIAAHKSAGSLAKCSGKTTTN
jgi:hypothetical protein